MWLVFTERYGVHKTIYWENQHKIDAIHAALLKTSIFSYSDKRARFCLKLENTDAL